MVRLIATLAVLMSVVTITYAQTGEITGKITDENGEGIPYANVQVVKDDELIKGATTDFNGFYSIKPLDPGKYSIKISYVGYGKVRIDGVTVNVNQATTINKQLKPEEKQLDEVTVTEYKVPLIDKESQATKETISEEEIQNLPTKDIQSIASSAAGVYQEEEGGDINVRGQRSSGTQYIIDGMKVRGSNDVPSSDIEQMTVITSGVPAKYGDAVGGVVNITTKGPSRELRGALDLETSQFLDPYGYNLAEFNLTGPLWKINKGTENERTFLGFKLSANYQRKEDRTPSVVGNWKVKDDKLNQLEESPLQPSPVGEGFVLSSERVTLEDMKNVDVQPNTVQNKIGATGRLDFSFTDNIDFRIGGTYNWNRYNNGSGGLRRYSLFNSDNNPQYTNQTYRVFGRFTQSFDNPEKEKGDDKSHQAFRNAFYRVQFDFTRVERERVNEDHGFNPFKYGYVGKFETERAPVYEFGTEDFESQSLRGYHQTGFRDTSVSFTPGDINPEYTNYTEQFYRLSSRNQQRSKTSIRLNGGLLNGDLPSIVHGTWYNTGYPYNLMAKSRDDQFSLSVHGSVDILPEGFKDRNKHSVEFGLEFEQRVDRSYSLNPVRLWELMRLRTNQQITELNNEEPTLIIEGQEYGIDDNNRPAFTTSDTVRYPRSYSPDDHSYFDKQLRQELGRPVDGTQPINVDALDPETFSLDMFSASEIYEFNTSDPIINTYGYDYKGNQYNNQISFKDFWRETDDDGNLTRPVDAFRPIYTAGYIQDRFYFKDLLFNVGVRVDRFDANQKVLRDKYSLYAIKTVDELQNARNTAVPGDHPSTIGSDYKVYGTTVEDNDATRIVGYRKGDTWYNAEGNEINDPAVIQKASNTGSISPVLVDSDQDIKATEPGGFDPDLHFKDYEPQVTVMPRVAFNFEITDEASFTGHYDVLTQRPKSRLNATPDDYLFLEDNVGQFINNPNLKPEKTVDYQLGFEQRVSKSSAVTISAFYREVRDMIQAQKVDFAYPNTYQTFDNIDFGTIKGLSLSYDLRRTGNVSLNANYTLQFAEGTGSDATSQADLVDFGQPNLRTIVPLDYDSRHQLDLRLNYSYAEGKDYNGPSINGVDFLSNTGASVTLQARSGEPYTKQANASAEALFTQVDRPILEGQVNGSRLPWNIRLGGRIYKRFNLDFSGKQEKNQDPISVKVYLLVKNIFNQRNVTDVYPYTGNADDDGYLSSPEGQQLINNREEVDEEQAQSFQDQYRAWINDPQNYGIPRFIRLGATLNF